MQNRRQNFRLYYSAAERPSVKLELMSPRQEVHTALLDLSAQGMRVRIEGKAPPLCVDDALVAHLELPRLDKPLSITCTVVYLERNGTGVDCGVHFRPLLLPAADEKRDAQLRRYLLDEERRQRKKRRNAGGRLKLFTGSP